MTTLLIALLLVGQLRAPGKPVVSGDASVDPVTWHGSIALAWDDVPEARMYRVYIRSSVYGVASFGYVAIGYEVTSARFGPWSPPPGGYQWNVPVADGTEMWISVSAVNADGFEGPRSPELRTVYRTP